MNTPEANKEIAKKLINLAQLDIDAVEAYEQALKNIDVSNIHRKISEFRDDHIQHIEDLSEIITALGETPPKRTKDIKGFLIAGFTAIRSATGTMGALKAMRGNEELTNRKYHEALEWELPTKIKHVVEKNYEDEKRHLRYIENKIKEMESEK